MSKHNVFLPLMVAMTRVGEEVGNLDETLITVAQNYETEAEQRLQAALGLIEPLMMVVMGGVVGFIAMAMFGAIYGMLGQMGR